MIMEATKRGSSDSEDIKLVEPVTSPSSSRYVGVNALLVMAESKHLEDLLREAQHVLPEFPSSLNLVIWAAFKLNELELAESILKYMNDNDISTPNTIQLQDSEELRSCKVLAESVRLQANSLALELIQESTLQSVTLETIDLAASNCMLECLHAMASRKFRIYQARTVRPSSLLSGIVSAVRTELHVTWDMVYEKIATFCTRTEIE
jgi:hypothetical protein